MKKNDNVFTFRLLANIFHSENHQMSFLLAEIE